METQICVIESDLHEERAGFFRAFYTASLDAPTMCSVFGYCTAGHMFRTIKSVVHDFRKYDRTTPVFRNNKRIA